MTEERKEVKLKPMHAFGNPGTPESLLGERVRYARGDLNLSIEALSRLTEKYDSKGKGVSATSISRYESGANLPGTVEFRLLCDALGVPADWLIYGDLPNSGRTESEQALIQAMRYFINAQEGDAFMNKLLVKPHLQWVVKGVREQLLSEARKPDASKKPPK